MVRLIFISSSNRTESSVFNWCFLDARETPMTLVQDTRASKVFCSTLSSVQGTSNSVNLERASNMIQAGMFDSLSLRLKRNQRKKALSVLATPGK